MQINEYSAHKVEDFKIGQKVKVLVTLGKYISEMKYSRLGQVGEIVEIDYYSVRVLFTAPAPLRFPREHEQWYRAEEILPCLPTTNAERQAEIAHLHAQSHELSASIVKLMKEIKDAPEKTKAEVGDKVRFKYTSVEDGAWIYMYIMTGTQAEEFGGMSNTNQKFRFQGPGGERNVNAVNYSAADAFEFCKKNSCNWIDSKEVDWSGILI